MILLVNAIEAGINKTWKTHEQNEYILILISPDKNIAPF